MFLAKRRAIYTSSVGAKCAAQAASTELAGLCYAVVINIPRRWRREKPLNDPGFTVVRVIRNQELFGKIVDLHIEKSLLFQVPQWLGQFYCAHRSQGLPLFLHILHPLLTDLVHISEDHSRHHFREYVPQPHYLYGISSLLLFPPGFQR